MHDNIQDKNIMQVKLYNFMPNNPLKIVYNDIKDLSRPKDRDTYENWV